MSVMEPIQAWMLIFDGVPSLDDICASENEALDRAKKVRGHVTDFAEVEIVGRDEADSLRADRERLEWLAANKCSARREENPTLWVIRDENQILVSVGPTLGSAIDEARGTK